MLWRSAPLETLMRLNAPIATLVLAGLTLAPATLLAKPVRHVAHKTATEASATKKHVQKTDEAATKPHKKRRKNKPRQEDGPEPITVSRVHARTRGHRSRATHIASATRRENEQAPQAAASTVTRKATSEDFVRAASGASTEPADAVRPATGVSRPPDDDEEAPRSSPPVEKVAPADKAVSAMNSRPAAQRQSRDSLVEEASEPVVQPALYYRRGRLVVPPPLKGSHEILVRQNVVANREGLDRIKDDNDLDDMRAHGFLVSLPTSSALQVDEKLPSNRRYCRPWTAEFLRALARAHYARFHTPLQVNSAVRTVEFQQRLQRTNGNAAPAEGETASPHLTGQAIDLAKHGLSLTEIAWLRGYLMPLVQQGKIDVEEEFQQSCFHISVYKRYLPASRTPKRDIASGSHSATAALATAIP